MSIAKQATQNVVSSSTSDVCLIFQDRSKEALSSMVNQQLQDTASPIDLSTQKCPVFPPGASSRTSASRTGLSAQHYLCPVAKPGQVKRQPAKTTARDKDLRPCVPLMNWQPFLDLLADPAIGLCTLRQTLLGPVSDCVLQHIPAPFPPCLSHIDLKLTVSPITALQLVVSCH